jgi:outer membrane protein OmpU
MNNFKKIGMTALAASLVSVSANAGAISVSGGASLGVTGHTGEGLNAGTSFSMGNQLTFSGSGELDNGLNVSVSFVLDQGDNDTTAASSLVSGAPFDSHSVTVSSDGLGSLTFNGEGGGNATSAISGTAAGGLWDAFDQLSNNAGITFPDLQVTISAGNNAFVYTSPALMEGLTGVVSYQPQGANSESATGYGINYSGVEGLTLNYATTDIDGTSAATRGDNSAMKASYAYGPVTVTYSQSENDLGSTGIDNESTSYALSYTVSDALSVTYGSETHEQSNKTVDAEIDAISFAYTAGGMTLSGSMKDGENLDYSTNSAADVEQWTLGASFAF